MSHYISKSTIDDPPDGKEMQTEAFEENRADELLSAGQPDWFKFRLQLSLVGEDGIRGPNTIAIAAGDAPADRIEEILCRAFLGEYAQRRLRAIVGAPMDWDNAKVREGLPKFVERKEAN